MPYPLSFLPTHFILAIEISSIYGDIFPATILDGGYSGGGGRLAIIVGGHDQK